MQKSGVTPWLRMAVMAASDQAICEDSSWQMAPTLMVESAAFIWL